MSLGLVTKGILTSGTLEVVDVIVTASLKGTLVPDTKITGVITTSTKVTGKIL